MVPQSIEEMIFEFMRIPRGQGKVTVTVDDVRQAAHQIETGEQRLRWALTFAETDLDKLSALDWVDLCLRLAAFTIPMSRVLGVIKKGNRLPLSSIMFPSKRDIQQTHERFRNTLQICSPGADSVVYRPDYKVAFELRHGIDGEYTLTRSVRGRVDQCVIALMELLAEHGKSMRVCPVERDGCGRRFLAGKGDQEYCTTRCGNRARTRRNRREKKR